MDKNFNDQELSDIMKEIESLEEEFKGEQAQVSDVIDELAELDEKVAIPQKAPKKEVIPFEAKAPKAAPAHVSSGSTKESASMSFKVSGDMKIDLKFEVGGKIVGIEMNEHGLSINMDGGMTFSVPLKDGYKKVG